MSINFLIRHDAYAQEALSEKAGSYMGETPTVEHVRHMRAHKKPNPWPDAAEKERLPEEAPKGPDGLANQPATNVSRSLNATKRPSPVKEFKRAEASHKKPPPAGRVLHAPAEESNRGLLEELFIE